MLDNKVDKIKIYFIRHPDGSLDHIEKFLRQRDFDTYSNADVKEAFADIIKIQPAHVFICLDHPNEKINAIPKLLLQSLIVTVIPYVNGNSVNNIRMIQTFKSDYKLFPPNSSPSVLRLLNKIAKDQAQGNDLPKEKKETGQIINASNQKTVVDSKLYRVEGHDSLKNSWDLKQNQSGKSDDKYTLQHGHPPTNLASYGDVNPTYESKASDPTKTDQGRNSILQSPDINSVENNYNGVSFPLSKNSMGTSNASTPQTSEHSGNENSNLSYSSFQKTRAIPTKKGKNKEASSLEKSAEDVLNEITGNPFSDFEIQTVNIISNATCFAVDSTKFTGYLVAVFAGKKKIDHNFLNLMKQRLKEFLLLRGEDLNPSDKMEVQLIEVHFENWAIEQAEFLRKSVHEGNEMAMAFFQTQHPRINILPSESKDMLKVSIDDIDENKAVKFNLYIYLSINKRYVLYTPKGGTLGRTQKNRLKKKGILDVHFKKNETHSFKTYQAENYLNNKITELQTDDDILLPPKSPLKKAS